MSEQERHTLARPAPTATAAARPTTADRDRVIALLSDRFADDTLALEELERRVTLAQRSETLAELQALTADLGAPAAAAAPAAPPARTLVPAAKVRRSALVVSIMGGTERKGPWSVPRTLNVLALMGGSRLDFREAQLPAGVVELRVAAVMGGVEVIVPPNLAVEASGIAVMGGFEHVDRAPTQPDESAPLLRITGVALMGGVSIEMRLPGESQRDARKRRRRERKALRPAE